MKYIASYSLDRDGFCIYLSAGGLTITYVAGPFESKEHAEAECHRLNTQKDKA